MADTDTRLAIEISAQTKQFENALKRLDGTLRKSMAASTRSVASLDSQFRRMSSTALKAAGALGIAFSARILVNFVKNAVLAGEAIGDAADKLGITAEAFQGLAYAADQSGTSVESVQTAFKGMTVFLGEIERGSKAAKLELKAIGLTVDDLKGKSPDEIFKLFLDSIGKIEDPLRRNAELLKFFGKSGLEMSQMAQLSAKGIDALIERARALGIIISNETIKKAQEAGDKIGDLGAIAQAAGIKMAAEFVPAIDALHDLVTSQAFQDGLVATAKNIGGIVEWIAKLDPRALQVLLAAAAGSVAGGPLGAVVAGTFATGNVIGNEAINAVGRARGVVAGPKGDRINSGRPATSPFADDAAFTNAPMSPALAAAVNKAKGIVGGSSFDAAAADAERLAKAIEEINNQIEASLAATKRWNDALMDLGGAGFDVFADIITGAKDAKTAILDFLQQLFLAEAKAAFLHLLNPSAPTGPLTTLLSGLSGRAAGGPVMAGTPYMVGERGPELFIPRSAGRISPNGASAGAGGRIEVIIRSMTTPLLDQHIDVRATGVSVRVLKQGAAQSQRQSELAA